MTRLARLARTGLMIASLLISARAAVTAQTIVTFDVPDSTSTIPQGNNLLGQIAGYYQDSNFAVRAFLRQANGDITTFDVNGSTDTKATGINDLGWVTGSYIGTDSSYHGFVRKRNASIATFDAPNSPYTPQPDVCEWQTTDTFPAAINLTGRIAGVHRQRLVSIVPGVTCAGIQYQGFIRKPNGTMATFGIAFPNGAIAQYVGPHSINLPGQITGWYQYTDIGGPIGGFLRRSDASIVTFLDDNLRSVTHATGINLFGQITGSSRGADSQYHAFLRQPNGNIVTFDTTGSGDTEASSINDVGQVTGYYLATDNAYHGFLRQWNGAIDTFDAPGAGGSGFAGTFPQSINLFGQITGYYQDANFVLHGFIRQK